MRYERIRAGVLALAAVGTTTISMVSTATPALAHCVGSSIVSSSSGSGTEYNLNANTWNGDTIYTGRFSDVSTSVSSNVADTVSGLLWTYDEADSASWFQICHTNGSGVIIACASRGTNSGY